MLFVAIFPPYAGVREAVLNIDMGQKSLEQGFRHGYISKVEGVEEIEAVCFYCFCFQSLS